MVHGKWSMEEGEGGNQDTTEILRYAQNDRLQYRATEPRGDNLETTFRLGPVRRTQGRPFDVAPFGKLRVNPSASSG